jgi:hypothetical protein
MHKNDDIWIKLLFVVPPLAIFALHRTSKLTLPPPIPKELAAHLTFGFVDQTFPLYLKALGLN